LGWPIAIIVEVARHFLIFFWVLLFTGDGFLPNHRYYAVFFAIEADEDGVFFLWLDKLISVVVRAHLLVKDGSS